MFHSDIIRELTLDSSSNQTVLTIASMSKDLAYLRQLRNQSPGSVAEANKVPLRASEAWLRVSIKCHLLRTHQNPFVRSTAKAMELILNMTCPPQPIGRATELAVQLKEALSELPGRSCMYMDLTSCSLILGAVAAEEGSEAHQWYIARLKRAIDAMRDRGWDDPYSILEKTMSRDQDMLARAHAMRTVVLSARPGQPFPPDRLDLGW